MMSYLTEFTQFYNQDESVYIHLDFDPSIPKTDRLGKEECLAAGLGNVCNIFNLTGVEEAAVLPYLVWVAKSPAYGWEDVLPGVLSFIGAGQELPGSGRILGDEASRQNLRTNIFEKIPRGQQTLNVCDRCEGDIDVFPDDGCTLESTSTDTPLKVL